MADKNTSSAASSAAVAADAGEPSIEDLQNMLSGSSAAATEAEAAEDEELEDSEQEDESSDDSSEDDNADGEEAEDSTEDEGEEGEESDSESDGESEEDDDQSEDDQEAEENAGTEDPDDESDEETQAIRKRFTPEQQKLFDKAISKKAKRIIELRTELDRERKEAASTKTELEQLKAGVVPTVVAATPDNPFSGVHDEKSLDKRIQGARELRKWALTHSEGGTLKVGEQEVEISKERIGEILAETEETLNHHAPKRREFIRLRAVAETEAAKEYPWFADKSSEGRVRIEGILNTYPALAEMIPDIRPVLADMITMQTIKARNRAAAAAGKGKPAAVAGKKSVPKAPSVPTGARPPKISGATKAVKAKQKRLEDTGDDPEASTLRDLLR